MLIRLQGMYAVEGIRFRRELRGPWGGWGTQSLHPPPACIQLGLAEEAREFRSVCFEKVTL